MIKKTIALMVLIGTVAVAHADNCQALFGTIWQTNGYKLTICKSSLESDSLVYGSDKVSFPFRRSCVETANEIILSSYEPVAKSNITITMNKKTNLLFFRANVAFPPSAVLHPVNADDLVCVNCSQKQKG